MLRPPLSRAANSVCGALSIRHYGFCDNNRIEFPVFKKKSRSVYWTPLIEIAIMDVGPWEGRESSYMPKTKEFTVTIADKPGALGKFFLALAERGVDRKSTRLNSSHLV